jgi:hypothetical protein
MSGVGHAADKAGPKKYEIPATNDPNLKLEIVYQGNYTPGLRIESIHSSHSVCIFREQ